MLPARPAANNSVSGPRRSPQPAQPAVSAKPLNGCHPGSRRDVPIPAKARASTSEISASMNGTSRSATSSRVTSAPSAVNTEAYSHPTGPPP